MTDESFDLGTQPVTDIRSGDHIPSSFSIEAKRFMSKMRKQEDADSEGRYEHN